MFRPPSLDLDRDRRRQRLGWRIYGLEWLVVVATLSALTLGHGVQRWETALSRELGVLALAAMVLLTGGLVWRLSLSLDWRSFVRTRTLLVAVHVTWLAALPVIGLMGLPAVLRGDSTTSDMLLWSEFAFWMRVLASSIQLLRFIAAARSNPAFVLVGSFLMMIFTGTLLLMLPVCRVQPSGVTSEVGAPPLVALFTATSASCVTGLTVVDTGTYWTGTGQTVILALIQIGGLGIMTFGAFFALGQRRGFLVRERIFMGKLLEADDAQALRRTIAAIIVFTLASEAVGAALLSTLSPAESWQERAWFGLFHSISSFCNAGFSLLPKSLEGLALRWQVAIVVAPLIILGGLGFDVLRNAAQATLGALRRRWSAGRGPLAAPARLTVTSRMVLGTTAALLVAGAASFFILEAGGLLRGMPIYERLSHSWFQAVTFRTAGFNTVDFSHSQPTTRLVGIGLMFIGASPGSTGGGIKTVVFALMVLATTATVRGKERLEIAGRSIPDEFIRRGAAVVALALAALLTSTLLVVMFEQRPELFLDHLFETTSALGTVGLSSVGTANLKPASQLVLAATMFLGRVGPLTILVALTRRQAEPNYSYPSERVMLG
ncbi:MAG TPA: potassium transporter TrkG [Pirellulaceae bacterium]|nr:potassium transporter TrkG [Pirellulaceae bacterium]